MSRDELLKMAAFFVGYLIAGQIGVELFTAPAIISPAAGLGLAVLVIKGRNWWPIIFIASTLIFFANGAPLFSIIILPLAHALQAVAGAYLLEKLGFNTQLRRLRDMLLIMGVAVVTSAIVPTLGYAARFLNNYFYETQLSSATWGTWWTGLIMSVLIIAPFMFCWFVRPLPQREFHDVIEIIASYLVLVIINIFLFFTTIGNFLNISLIYFLLIPLFWIALRVGTRFMTVALLTTAVFAILGTVVGPAAAAPEQLGTRLFQLEVFISIIAIIFLILVGIEEERKVALKTLRFHVSDLEEALRKLGSQDRAKNEFLAILAHELRNPLSPIVSSLDLLKLKGTLPKEESEILGVVDGQVKRMRRLLDDLLDISRISRQKLTLQKKPTDMRAVVVSSIQAIKHLLEDRKQKLERELPAEEILVDCDAMRLEQVCINVLNNASKFTGEGGVVTISLFQKNGRAELRIKDSGIGISKELLERVFEPFLQAELGQRSTEGLGIGLSLAKTLVEMHGGTIHVESEGKNRGSEFVIFLPLFNSPLPAASPLPAIKKLEGIITTSTIIDNAIDNMKTFQTNSHQGEVEARRVLIVDDNMAAASGVATLLQLKGYGVECAYSGREAKEKAISFKPSIVLLDIGLPDMEGYDVAKALRAELGFNGPIIALTGYGQSDDKGRAYEAGFDYHLTKPVGINELEAALLGYAERLTKVA